MLIGDTVQCSPVTTNKTAVDQGSKGSWILSSSCLGRRRTLPAADKTGPVQGYSGLVFLDRGWIDALSLVLILPGPCLAKERSLHSPMPGSLQQDNTTTANQLSHRTGPGRWEKKVGGVGMVVVDCH